MRRHAATLLSVAAFSVISACAATRPPAPAAAAAPAVAPQPMPAPETSQTARPVTGTASWYESNGQPQRTASGQMFNNNGLTAASSVIPMGTKVRVARPGGGQAVVVTVNDRMPPNHRVIDVSPAAANRLGLKKSGVATVTVTPVKPPPAP